MVVEVILKNLVYLEIVYFFVELNSYGERRVMKGYKKFSSISEDIIFLMEEKDVVNVELYLYDEVLRELGEIDFNKGIDEYI